VILHPLKDSNAPSGLLLSARGICKRFCRNYKRSLFYGLHDIVGEIIDRPFSPDRLREYEFWALRDLSFELQRGEALGIVGRNGSGKTTMMRILSGLIRPTSGHVEKKGLVAPLLALGAGFNPLLTGRENIYVNMMILGLGKEQIDARFNQVVDFAEIPESLDSIVQNYSSGMVARLGFSCAVHTSPDVMLIDEVMAVGDSAFRMKCMQKILEMREAGTSFIIVNHAPQLIVDTCQRAIYLKDGCCAMEGESLEVVRKYEEDLRMTSVKQPGPVLSPEKTAIAAAASHEAQIISCYWNSAAASEVIAGQSASLVIETAARKPQKAASLMLRIEPAVDMQTLHWRETRSAKAQAASVLVASNARDDFPIRGLAVGTTRICVKFNPLCLAGGHYRLLVWLFASDGHEQPELVDLYTAYFDVRSDESMQGSNFYQPRSWCVLS